jgi:AAHS family benzoate transporter-like MFS transporter
MEHSKVNSLNQKPPVVTRWALLVVPLICWLGLVSDGYDLFSYGATLPGMIGVGPWNITAAEGGLVGSISLIGMLCGSLVAGTLTDILGRRRLFLFSVTLFSVAMIACAIAPSFAIFGCCRFLTGFGIGGLLPTGVALASEFANPKYRSRILGAVLTGPPVGGLLATIAAINLVPSGDFRWVYAIGGFALVVVLPLAIKALPESPSFLRSHNRIEEADRIAVRHGLPIPAARPADAGPTSSAGSPVKLLFRRGYAVPTVGLWAVNLCSLLVSFGVSTWLPQIMRNAGYSLGSALTFLLIYNVGAIVGTLIASTIAERIGAKYLVLIGFGSAAIALALLGTHPPTALLMLLIAITGFGGLGTQNMLNDHVAGFYPADARATGLGWALGIGRLGAIAGPTYGALFVTAGAGVLVSALAFAAPAVLGAVVMSTLPRRGPLTSVEAAAEVDFIAVH